jgi:hypothetical protein
MTGSFAGERANMHVLDWDKGDPVNQAAVKAENQR